MSVFLRPGSREDLEREVLRAIERQGYCYAGDPLIQGQIGTPAQADAWAQGFCARESLRALPYEEPVTKSEAPTRLSPVTSGLIFRAAAGPSPTEEFPH